jgi:hypothetical protein
MSGDLNAWKQEGNVYLWRYPDAFRNFPGWHLSADSVGAESLLELLSRLGESAVTAYRTVRITEPTRAVLSVPNNRGGNTRFWSPLRLRLVFDPSDVASTLWELRLEHGQVNLSVGEKFRSLLVAGIVDIMERKGDYSIGGHRNEPKEERTCLWFWW